MLLGKDWGQSEIAPNGLKQSGHTGALLIAPESSGGGKTVESMLHTAGSSKLSPALGDRGRGRVMCLERRIRTPYATSTASPGVSDRGGTERESTSGGWPHSHRSCAAAPVPLSSRDTQCPPRCGRAVLVYVCQGRVCITRQLNNG
jgi:hypothetical protein